jgi:hypothetical protein
MLPIKEVKINSVKCKIIGSPVGGRNETKVRWRVEQSGNWAVECIRSRRTLRRTALGCKITKIR